MEPSTPAATVYYDGACPVCRREIAHYRAARGAEALAFVDAAACPDTALPPGLSRQAAMARMHVRLADGRLATGAAAFAALWRNLPGFAWLGRIAGLPVVLPLLERAYRGFLALRRAWR